MRDDYDDGYDRRPASNSNKTLWIVLGVLAGLFLTVLLVCGGLMYFGFQTVKDVATNMTAATGAAESFLSQLQNGNTAGAYQSTSQSYRATQTQAQFDAFVAANPALTTHTGRNSNSFNMMKAGGVDKMRMQYTLTGPKGATVCTLVLVEENGTWVIDSITVP